MTETVLFLCTGNYYRSRFAEHLFNHLASAHNLPWTADSRALAVELGTNNIGPISPHTLTRLQALSIPLPAELRYPQQVVEADLNAAALTIALDRTEHYPYVAERLPTWVDRIEYWEVADLHALDAKDALDRIEVAVQALIRRCISHSTGS
ncbi:MAG: low molecular weight phosphatase family protein [Caldilineaceae bacterium]